jgi:hypothetical protein
MKIEKVTRLVSDKKYGNISMTAFLEENETPINVVLHLDDLIKKAISEIERKGVLAYEQRRQTNRAISVLERALKSARDELDELPF